MYDIQKAAGGQSDYNAKGSTLEREAKELMKLSKQELAWQLARTRRLLMAYELDRIGAVEVSEEVRNGSTNR